MLGIEHPIIMGSMGLISNAKLAAAVSDAGGLGFISSVAMGPQELKQEICKAKSLTNKPLGVNLSLLGGATNVEALIDTALEEGVKVFETSGINPEPYIKRMKDGGARVIHKTPAVRFALKVQHIGVDAVAIIGQGGGGHLGMDLVSSMVLIPAAVDALSIPVIAGGEIADARGFVAALALGAQGILMGTRFMITRESPIHSKTKQWLVEAKETDTILIEKSIRNPGRVMSNEAAYKLLGMESLQAKADDLMLLAISGFKEVMETGNTNAGIFYCGQAAGLVHDIPTVKEVIDSIIAGAKTVGQHLTSIGLPTQ